MMQYINESQILLKKQMKNMKNNDDSDSDHQFFQDLEHQHERERRQEYLLDEMVRECGYNDIEKMILRNRLDSIFQHIAEQEKQKPKGYIPQPASIKTKCKVIKV